MCEAADMDENNPGVALMRSTGVDGGNGKIAVAATGKNRRALSNINRNIIGAPPPPHPRAVSKRVVSEKSSIREKKQCLPVQRPITRNFAAQLLKQQHQNVSADQGRKKDVNQSVASSESLHSSITELYGYDESVEAMMEVEETGRMVAEEIEMGDIDEERIIDIDSPDKNNCLAVVEYVDELYAHYKKLESSSCVSPKYMDKQADINDRMRGILIDWLIEVHYKFELMDETLYLTVNLIDRFLSVQSVVRKKLQLVGVTAMLLACKYEEVTVPVVDDLILISDKAYTRKEVLDMEKLMVNTLQFNISVPTPYVFLRRFLKAAIADTKLELLAFYIIELSLVEYEMLKFPPSLLAAAAVFTAQCSLAGSKQWSRTSQWYSTYSADQLMECARLMVALHQKAPTSKLTGVHHKYSLSKYGHAANSEPAQFLLEEDR
uniref:Uncharacterized protein n=3 Tax=Kalanchoe fedtschenkoi TaxID=63787 RepID=A0A7N0SV33_KALFE